jgi:GST-like protein
MEGGSKMIQLFSMVSPNVVKIYIALEELGLPYEVQPVDVILGKQFEPEFLKLNPNAKVPVIVDSDGPAGKPFVCFESGAILLYLAEKTGRLLPQDIIAKYDALQWLMVQLTTVGPMFGQCIHFHVFAPKDGNDYARSRYTTQAIRVFQAVERRLAAAPWLTGLEYGIADIATWPWARNIPRFLSAEVVANLPATTCWIATISERPAVKAALRKVEELRAVVTALDKAAPEDIDRLFGRGQFAAA